MPADFHLHADSEGNLKLRKRYNVGGLTIERWRKILNVRYTAPAMPKRPTRPIAIRKAKKHWMMQEQIEDLDDGFDLAVCVRSGGAGGW
ncbi:MAG TPA: hypothetical protein VF635_06705 [Propionibacteriaceae bacterium]